MNKVELIYIAANQLVVHVRMILKPGMTVGEAIVQSGLALSHPEVEGLPVGIFSKSVSKETVLKNGDRIEIYRPLIVDPKQNRRQRARLK